MATLTRTVLLSAALLGLVNSADAQATTANDKVVQFCKDNVGEKIGNGECVYLAEAALKHAEAKARTAFKEFPKAGDYTWGKLVYALEMKDDTQTETKVLKQSIQPGDIIQFGGAKFEGRNLRGFVTYSVVVAHHTAVIVDVKMEDNVLTVLEQNAGGKRTVMENPYRVTDLKTGWLRVYRPVPK